MTGACLIISLVGLFCYLAGLSNPRQRLYEESKKLRKKKEIEEEEIYEPPVDVEQYYDHISEKMLDQSVVNKTAASSLFNESKVISETDFESKKMIEAKKKKFLRDHL
jgi:hypothetical protein